MHVLLHHVWIVYMSSIFTLPRPHMCKPFLTSLTPSCPSEDSFLILTSQSHCHLINLSFYSCCSQSITKHPWHSSSPMLPCLRSLPLSTQSVVLDVGPQVFKLIHPLLLAASLLHLFPSHSCPMCPLHWQTVQVLRLVIFNGKIWSGDIDVNMSYSCPQFLNPVKKVKSSNNLQSANFKRAIKMSVSGW